MIRLLLSLNKSYYTGRTMKHGLVFYLPQVQTLYNSCPINRQIHTVSTD